jgi:hypothetical protein
VAVAGSHPNEVDRLRIQRALAQRKRYRYVTPHVRGVAEGYLVQSPCCSRNVDTGGGPIDVALLQYALTQGPWQLFRRDRRQQHWQMHGNYARLPELLLELNEDSLRVFWP